VLEGLFQLLQHFFWFPAADAGDLREVAVDVLEFADSDEEEGVICVEEGVDGLLGQGLDDEEDDAGDSLDGRDGLVVVVLVPLVLVADDRVGLLPLLVLLLDDNGLEKLLQDTDEVEFKQLTEDAAALVLVDLGEDLDGLVVLG
jgi:hypothetical protein